jgi:hypothetical protein
VFKITDRKERKGLLTKTVKIIGFPTVIFCTANMTVEDQERTRFWLLSPETTDEKILEGLNLIALRESDRATFKKWLEEHPQRRWLKMRVELIRKTGIKEVVIPESEKILSRFLAQKTGHVKPRDLRDFPRLLRLIKAVALLNCFSKPRVNDTVLADDGDVDQAFRLYEAVAEPNELGLPPAIYEVYERVVKREALPGQGATPKDIARRYFFEFKRPLSMKRWSTVILPTLLGAGLIYEEPDPDDRRRTRIHLAMAPGAEEAGDSEEIYSPIYVGENGRFTQHSR